MQESLVHVYEEPAIPPGLHKLIISIIPDNGNFLFSL